MVKVKSEKSGNKTGSKHLTDSDKDKIFGALLTGLSVNEIAKLFNVPERTIYRYKSRIVATKSVDRIEDSGRPRVTTKVEDRAIIRAMKKDRGITSDEILISVPTLKFSAKTIRRRIVESGEFNSYWTANKPFVSETNRKIRVQWCKDRLHWTPEQWRRVIEIRLS